MDNIRSEILFTLKNWEKTIEEPHPMDFKNVKTVWLEYNKFLEYMSLETKDRVKYLIENGDIEY